MLKEWIPFEFLVAGGKFQGVEAMTLEKGSAEVFTMNNAVTTGSSNNGSGDNLCNIPTLAGAGFEIPVSLPRALTITLFLYEMCHLHILMWKK